MRRVLILILLSPLVMAQGIPLPRCDLGAAVHTLEAAERHTARPLDSLRAARAAGAELRGKLSDLAPRLALCGCAALAEAAGDAALAAAPAESAGDAAAAARAVEAGRERLRWLRQGFAARGCA